MPLERVVLRDQVRELLAERILRGDYPPGHRLVETQLAQELGTSQAPVREALRELESAGLIEHTPYRGARVRDQMPRQMLDVFPVREALEVLAVRLGAARLAREPARLDAAFAAMTRAAHAGDIPAFFAADAAFHGALIDASGNGPLSSAYNVLAIERRLMAALSGIEIDLYATLALHEPLLEALKAGRSGAAVKELRRHFADVLALVKAAERAQAARER